MADLPAAQANAMLNAAFVPTTTYYLSLHSGNPGTTGANELSGGSYARQVVVFAAASGGSQSSSDSQSFTGLSGPPTVPYFGVWSALSSGTYLGGGPLTTPITAAAISFNSGGITLTVS